jgi:hypothetical protein
MKHTIKVRLNGTNENPWHKFSLTCNPIGKAEWDAGQRALASLDGDPLLGEEDIRARLKGRVSNELIELCVSQFKPGKRVEFEFWFDDEERGEGT